MILAALALLAAAPQLEAKPSYHAARAAKVFTAADGRVLDNAIVLWKDGRIVAVGRPEDLELPPGLEIEDLGDLWLVPGLVEPHCHSAGSLADLNDMVYLANPALRTVDIVDPGNPLAKDALAGGVTSALLLPGSGTNLSGYGTLVKYGSDRVAESVVRAPGSLKVAQAGNPEVYDWGVRRAFMNWDLRHTLKRGLDWARRYRAGQAPLDWQLADFQKLLAGTLPVSVHTQIYQVVLMTITMLKGEFGFDVFIDHGTFDGYKAGPMAVEYGVPVMNGPRQFWFDRSRARFQGCAAGWAAYVPDGLLLGYNTDAPVVPQEELSFQAAMGVRLGHDDPAAALEGITCNSAKVLRYDQQAGSLRPGLDADLVAWTGFPLDPRSSVVKVWVRGKLVYDAKRERRRF